MSDTYRIVGTAGHIDHGKSALVRSLTGVDPDRLQEEKERGITIDLGFADARIGELWVGFIDVPGHERFVKNMLAGIGGIDAVLLVVAADESIMPQTREHLSICSLLGVQAGVVAVTKCDLVDQELVELVQLEVRELLADTPLRDAEIVQTSVEDGRGLEELQAALERCLAAIPERPGEGLLRLPVDRVFSIKGFGTVVTGTLLSGSLQQGERLEAVPGSIATTIRGIQLHGAPTDVARAGQRTALNLQGVQVEELDRGVVLARPGTLRADHLVDARLEVLPGHEIEQLQRVRFHHGAAEVLGRVALLEGSELPEGGTGLVQLRLESPYPAVPGDRFILRRYSPVITIAGGTVLDLPEDKHKATAAVTRRLSRLENAGPAERVGIFAESSGLEPLTLDDLGRRLGQPRQEVEETVERAIETGSVERRGDLVVSASVLQETRRRIRDSVARYHERYPLRPGIPKEELRSELPGRPPASTLDIALEPMLEAEQIRAAGDGFALSDHVPRVPREDNDLRDRILARLEEAGLTPPKPEDLIDEVGGGSELAREILFHLLRKGELTRVRDDFFLHTDAEEKLIDALRHRFDRGTQFSIAEFRDWAGVTRKHAIPLLEHLDSLRVTRRVGDLRERI